jgi:hypothetical protein
MPKRILQVGPRQRGRIKAAPPVSSEDLKTLVGFDNYYAREEHYRTADDR